MEEKALETDACPGLTEAVLSIEAKVSIFSASMTIIG